MGEFDVFNVKEREVLKTPTMGLFDVRKIAVPEKIDCAEIGAFEPLRSICAKFTPVRSPSL